MKKILIAILIINVIFLGAAGGLLFLAETYPFHPGNDLFELQDTAEQLKLRFTPGQLRKASWTTDLAERRLADLARAKNEALEPSIRAFGGSLDLALSHLDLARFEAPKEAAPIEERMVTVLKRAEIVVAALEQTDVDERCDALLAALTQALAEVRLRPAAVVSAVPAQVVANALTEAVPVPFLNSDFDHDFFPLTGAHAEAGCDACHGEGGYAATPQGCDTCHETPVTRTYPVHFEGKCEDCHTTEDWRPHSFAHVGVKECELCHEDDVPLGHASYIEREPEPTQPGVAGLLSRLRVSNRDDDEEISEQRACSTCHSDTEDWENFLFDHHDGFYTCDSCHTDDTPVAHYEGQCSKCHNTVDWAEATFDHEGYTECKECHTPSHGVYPVTCASCHTDDGWWISRYGHKNDLNCVLCHSVEVPVNHYAGNCETCHNSEDWTDVAMDHTGLVDCRSCHTKDDHYDGQCSNCHSTDDWWSITFSHKELSDCRSCHSREDHYSQQCSSCHTTSAWHDSIRNHVGLTDCQSCHTRPDGHYGGQCSDCHRTDNWSLAGKSHDALVDCRSCHSAPGGHYGGQCSNCHNSTTMWSDITFSHAGLADCASCHGAPVGHYPGQCSSCHNTWNWSEITVDHSAGADCQSCHARPDGHWPNQCSDCHSTGSWSDIDFDHDTYTNCKACHSRPADHGRGQCSRCHNTKTWEIPATPTPEPTATPEPRPTATPIRPTDTPEPPAP